MDKKSKTTPPSALRNRPYELRYSSEYFTNALYGEYPSWEAATDAKRQAIRRAVEHGNARLAASFEVV